MKIIRESPERIVKTVKVKHHYKSSFSGFTIEDVGPREKQVIKRILKSEYVDFDIFQEHGWYTFVTDLDDLDAINDLAGMITKACGYSFGGEFKINQR